MSSHLSAPICPKCGADLKLGASGRLDAWSCPAGHGVGFTVSASKTHTRRSYAASVPDLPLTGGCLCGGVRFEVTEPLVSAGYCHCMRCQRRTGTAAAASARIAPGSLRIVQGEELVRAYEPADGYAKEFCGFCGSALWSRHPEDPEVIGVRLGAFDGDPGIRPAYRQFVAYAACWEPLPDDGLPRFPESRTA